MEVDFCANFCAELALSGITDPHEEFEPEECEHFVLEHRHVPFEYFGQPDGYDTEFPATWHEEMREVHGDWLSWFKRDKAKVLEWEEKIFSECEILYLLEQDTKTHFLVYRDLIKVWPRGHPHLLAAEKNVEEAQKKLLQRKDTVSSLVNWAQGGSFEPMSKFMPVWQMRMRTLKDDASKE
ncbi:hypothetical protein F5Y06DRAFT_264956 [Hypoxylon sp. FL0890]|nr:hypothetical protein F5Y06DRAFT_264956 [Hypoxylon sp. FL0890]